MPFDRICEVCKKSFQVPSNGKGRFCSKVCMDVWQRSCRWEDRVGEKRAKEIREEKRQLWKEKNPNNDPRVLKIKSEKMTEYRKTHPIDGERNPFFGRNHSDELKKKFAAERKGKRFWNDEQFKKLLINTPKGENHPLWRGGISYLPYTGFTKLFKRKIRERDGNVCVECGKVGKNGLLATHHIDYDKNNTIYQNVITMCPRCHGKTNVNREFWTKHFQEKYKEKLKIEITIP